ncbi:16S rRNA (guanine(527)-N(7))-methyltransferase RsmG [Euzebya sp.]|uniref:16S rRNA (guanine(527)-N(7))-methyltransferase RsmG n=1 Tax=Euzebya sp. TaxID=1971409 RepID=UPI003518F542
MAIDDDAIDDEHARDAGWADAGPSRVSRGTPLSTAEQLELLGTLIAESPHNLVSSRDRGLVATVHIPESVAVVEALHAGDGQHWVDLGTGGGLPGLVAAILRPRVGWTLIDARQKKVDAVSEFIDVLGLENARAVAGRAEVLAHDDAFRGLYDGVVSRALARLDVTAELARGFLRPRGRLVVVKGPSVDSERGYFQRASGRLRMKELHTEGVGSADRGTVLVSIAAQGGPPRGIPRRNGIPQSSPLGGGRT